MIEKAKERVQGSIHTGENHAACDTETLAVLSGD